MTLSEDARSKDIMLNNNLTLSALSTVQILDSCLCLNTKKGSRTLTNIYDKALSSTGINSGQFAILLKIKQLKKPTLNILAEELNLKSSTISRALAPLERDNLIQLTQGKDKRTRCVEVTEKGNDTLNSGTPAWEAAQNKVLNALNPAEVDTLVSALNKISYLPY